MTESIRSYIRIAVIIVGVAVGGTASLGVHIYDGVRAPSGMYFLSYSTIYSADKLTGASGKTTTDDFGYTALKEHMRLSWYTEQTIVTALLPVGHVESDKLDQSVDGFGDLLVGAGVFLPIRVVDCLVMLVIDAPTAEYDDDKAINMGTGQWNFRPSVFIHKSQGNYTFDCALKYNIRKENHDTGYHPGDELSVAVLGTRKFGVIRVGPNIKLMYGDDQRQDGSEQPDSAKQRVSAGLEAYTRIKGWGVTFNVMADVYTENTTEGVLGLLKLVRKF